MSEGKDEDYKKLKGIIDRMDAKLAKNPDDVDAQALKALAEKLLKEGGNQ